MGLLNLEKGKEQDNGGKRKLEWGRLNLKNYCWCILFLILI